MKLETFQVAAKMEKCISALETLCKELDGIGEAKVDAQVDYDKELHIAMEQLKSEKSAVSTRRDDAKGILAINGITRTLGMADIRYKALHTKIDAAKSALCGWQSYNRHLDTTTHV